MSAYYYERSKEEIEDYQTRIVKLWALGDRLKQDIEYVEKKLGESSASIFLKPSLQADIVCICALLRSLLDLECLKDLGGYNIEVHEKYELPGNRISYCRKKMTLDALAKRATHYVYYAPSFLLPNIYINVTETQHICILSDWDNKEEKEEKLRSRAFCILDFIEIAKKVLERCQLHISKYNDKHKQKQIKNLLAHQKQIEEILSRQTPEKRKAKIGKRRFEVLILWFSLTLSKIADQLGVSESTIRRDRIAIRESYEQINQLLVWGEWEDNPNP